MKSGPIALPSDPGTSGWQAILPRREAAPPLQSDIDVDVLIIGAGFAGLSAARRLRQIDAAISLAVLEGSEVGTGPAGRNSGFMIDLPHDLSSSNYQTGSSVAEDHRQTRMNRAAIEFANWASTEYQMPTTALELKGKINAAATPRGHQHNVSYAKYLESLAEPYELLDQAAMQKLSGTDYYSSGLFTPGTAMLQPALYVRRLADGLVTEGIHLYENSPVVMMLRLGNGWIAKTDQGQVKANKVILAVNGMIERFGFFPDRLLHVFTYASMTRPLTYGESTKLGGSSEWAFTPSDAMGTTVRKIVTDRGERIVVRNRFTYDPEMSVPTSRISNVGRFHDDAFLRRFPMLAEVEMEYRWGGRLCLSLNGVGATGELQENLYSACCQNGLGTVKGSIAGIVAAELCVGERDSLIPDYRPEAQPRRLPPRIIMKPGANAYLRLRELTAGKDF